MRYLYSYGHESYAAYNCSDILFINTKLCSRLLSTIRKKLLSSMHIVSMHSAAIKPHHVLPKHANPINIFIHIPTTPGTQSSLEIHATKSTLRGESAITICHSSIRSERPLRTITTLWFWTPQLLCVPEVRSRSSLGAMGILSMELMLRRLGCINATIDFDVSIHN